MTGVVVFSLSAQPADSTGWRTDGTGSYPRAQPPVAWSTTKNVVWKAPMPGGSNSIPVLLEHRIFICSEPCMLLCLHKDDGRILWQRNSSLAELDIEPALREKIKLEQDEATRLDKEVSVLGRESEALRKKLKETPAARADIEKKLEELKSKSEALKERKQKLTLAAHYTERGKQPTAGYSSPTPVTNGKEVFVAFGNGLIACFDLDGQRKWLKLIEQSTAPFAHSNSPVLIGDKVLIHFADLVALRATDGSEIWRLKKTPAHGTPTHARIGTTDVAITPHGLMVRVDDGAVLADGLGMCGANSPILHDGVVYFVRGSATAVRLPDKLSTPASLQPLWKGKVKGGGYWFPSPVLHDGLLYAIDDRGIFSVLEAKSGKLVYEERVELDGTHYPSVSVAGNNVFLSTDKGNTLVVKAGSKFEVVGRNQLEPFRSSLVFEGKRMYVRTQKHLFCIGE
jgi:outer membrane protein assembly factor BamB